MEIIIDATNIVAGRLGAFAAKQALLGNKVVIVNSENAVISGTPKLVFEKYRYRIRETGKPFTGPFITRRPDMFLKRLLRGMLPHKRFRGREAFEKIMCYLSVPDEFKSKKFVQLTEANVFNKNIRKFITLKDLCQRLGYR